MSLISNLSHKVVGSLALLAAGCFSFSVSANDNYAVTGNVYSLDGNKLIFREYYTAIDGNQEVTVNYAKPDGNIFATKTLNYKGDVAQPEFEFHDKRDDEKVSAKFISGRLVLSHSLNYATNEKTIMDNATLVIDVGFDAFIQKNWGQLLAGKKVRFNYAVPKRMTTDKLQVQEIPASKSPLSSSNNPKDWRYFSITSANKFASIFADPIYLAYSQDKYLMRFYGRSTLDNDKGAEQDVKVEYTYQ